MDISLVIPLLNEEESLVELSDLIKKVMTSHNFDYEVLFIDDGSTDSSWEIIEKLSLEDDNIKGIKFRRNYGKSAALNVGFARSVGNVVITMDADLQDSPEEIPELYNLVVKEDYDLVSGWKQKRYDPLSKTIPTKLFNWAVRRTSGIYLHDFNCGLEAYKNIVIKSIDVNGEMHRYIPVLAKWAGFDRITEKSVVHQARKYGVTKFGLERFMNGFLDLLTITFVSRFGKKPMHLFGVFGTLMFLCGFVLFTYIGGNKLYLIFNDLPARNIANMSGFYLALTSMIIGVQLFLAGFIAEMVSRNARDRNSYQVEKEV